MVKTKSPQMPLRPTISEKKATFFPCWFSLCLGNSIPPPSLHPLLHFLQYLYPVWTGAKTCLPYLYSIWIMFWIRVALDMEATLWTPNIQVSSEKVPSPRQKSWPVIHKFNEKSYKQYQKCLLLADMYRGHKQCWYLFIPPSWIMISWILVDMLIFLSLPDIGFLNLIWLRVLALWKPGPSLGSSQTP